MSKMVTSGRNGRRKGETDTSVECSGCGEWYDAVVMGISKLTEEQIKAKPIFCRECLEERVDELERQNTGLSERCRELTHEVRGYKEELAVCKEELVKCEEMTKVRKEVTNEGVQGKSVQGEVVEVSEVKEGVVNQTPRKVNKVRKKCRVIVGDSMVKNMWKHVRVEAEGSKCTSLRGRGIKDVMDEAVNESKDISEGTLVIQGGGNGLLACGVNETVKTVMDGVRKIKQEKKDVRVAVVGVMRRPRSDERYERVRKEVNRRLQVELCGMKVECMKANDVGVSFLDLDRELTHNVFARDQVHLTEEGEWKCGRRVLELVLANESVEREGCESSENG